MTVTAAPMLLLGADIGGTATRVAVSTTTGEVLSVAAGPAGNPNSVGLEISAERIRTVSEQCLARAGPDAADRVVAAVIGLAGGARADEAFLTAVRPNRSAGPAPTGPRSGRGLLLRHSRTPGLRPGGRHRCRRRPRRRRRAPRATRRLGVAAGGRGIRLLARSRGGPGDPGWAAGRHEAARPPGRGRHPTRRKSGPGGDRPALLREPTGLAVDLRRGGARHAGDPVARGIADRAAAHLVDTLLDLDLDPVLPVVLAGSVATRPGPVRDALRARLDERLANPVLTAESGLVGARLARCRHAGSPRRGRAHPTRHVGEPDQRHGGMNISVP